MAKQKQWAPWSLIFLALGFWIVLGFRWIARSVQSGDGAEFVLATRNGGLFHPPGFPVLWWALRPFSNCSEATLTFVAGWISWISLGITLIALIWTFLHFLKYRATEFDQRRNLHLGLREFAVVSSFAFFILHPVVWENALVSEVFSLNQACMAIFILGTILGSNSRVLSHKFIPAALFGLACASHPISIVLTPLFVTLFFGNLRLSQRVFILFTAALGFLLPHITMLLAIKNLGSAESWPGWSVPHGFSDWIGFLIRKDFGAFQLQASNSKIQLSAFFEMITRNDFASAAMLFFAACFIGMFIRRPKTQALPFQRIKYCLLFSWVLSVALLLLARVGIAGSDMASLIEARAVLSRFETPFILITIFGFLIWASEFNFQKVSRVTIRLVWTGFFVVLLGLLARSDKYAPARNQAAEIYAAGLAESVDPTDFWIARTDLEVFYGFLQGDTNLIVRRFPIAEGLLSLPWYVERVGKSIEPRLKNTNDGRGSTSIEVVNSLMNANQSVLISSMSALEGFSSAHFLPTRKGLQFLVTHLKSNKSPSVPKREWLRTEKLCSLAKQLPDRPRIFWGHTQPVWFYFADSLDEAALQFDSSHNTEASQNYSSAARSLRNGNRIDSRLDCKI